AVTGVEMTTITLGSNANKLSSEGLHCVDSTVVFRSERCGLLSIPILAVPGRARHYSGALRNHLQLPTAIWQLEADVPTRFGLTAMCLPSSSRVREAQFDRWAR